MEVELLARLQFAITVMFHYIYPPISIGLGLLLVIMEGLYLKTNNKLYENMTKFFLNIFALTFAIGVATGIVMEFEFGTNWATYSRYVGDVFGSPLAAEGVFAFFLESAFLGILIFGWKKVSPRVHFFSTIMVAFGSMLSAVWIIVANTWMQTPAGFNIVGTGLNARAEITNFWEMVFNPFFVDTFTHTISAAWLTGSFLVIAISAYYILKGKHLEFSKSALKIALTLACLASLFQLFTGHHSAMGVAKYQPSKLAAYEAHYDSTKPADLYLFGWVNEGERKVIGVAIPQMLSILVGGSADTTIKGINQFGDNELPPINFVFQTYHLMVLIGMLLIGLSFLTAFLMWKKTLFDTSKPFIKLYLFALILSSLLPQAGNQLGWISSEVGRQPWIVYGLLKTNDAISKAVSAGEVLFSMILFTLIYILLFSLFMYLLIEKVKHGPEEPEIISSEELTEKTI